MSPRRFVLIVFPLLCLPSSGCDTFFRPRSALLPVPAASLPGEGLPAGTLCASTTRAPDRVPRLLNPVARERYLPDAGKTGSASRFGLRVGVLITQETEAMQWDPGLRLGAYYRGTHPAAERLVYEFGFDHMSVRGDDGRGGTVSSEIELLRCELLFGRWSGAQPGGAVYLLGGAEVGWERATWEPTGDALPTQGGGINVGIGIASPKGSWDLRVVYSILTDSGNAQDGALVAFGFGF